MISPHLHLCAAFRLACLWALLAATAAGAIAADVPATVDDLATVEELEFFEREVRPILVQHCYSCHSSDAKKLKAGLFTDSREGLIRGGDSGTAIVPHEPDASILIDAVRYESFQMPPSGKLDEKQIAVLEKWVSDGAAWPNEKADDRRKSEPTFDLHKRKSEHWAWQPIRSPSIPTVQDEQWANKSVDRFILAKLEAAGLQPAGDADKVTLMRRLYFDLIGLPPTEHEVRAFLNDQSQSATQRLVDRLLASPRFGERWGRHWLDLVRYSESRGHEFDNDSPNAYQYRDYIIRALNVDLPYDQLVTEHLAGDLLPRPRLDPVKGFNESVIGTGFWFFGEWTHSPVDIRKDESDRFDNMIDVMSKAFLGLTVSCARCHDHKFDAISTADYYALCGYLQSSDYQQVRFDSIEYNRRVAGELDRLDGQFRTVIHRELKRDAITLPPFPPLDRRLQSMVVFDCETASGNDWLQEGFVYGKAPVMAGQIGVETTTNPPRLTFASLSMAVNDSFWNELESISEKVGQDRNALRMIPRDGRTLRTPTFELTDGVVTCRVRGRGHVVACVDSHRMIAGPLHAETVRPIGAKDKARPDEPARQWATLDLSRYVGHRMHLEFTPAKDAFLEVSLVAQGAPDALLESYETRENVIADIVQQFARSARDALGDRGLELARSWASERSSLQGQVMKASRLAIAIRDGDGEDDRVLIRGNSSNPGKVEPRHFLTAIKNDASERIGSGSGRLELAQQITSPSNPLTDRVIVNRVWHHLMGRGIVATTDDFGVLGSRPTHPRLLDHLATTFRRDGQSLKRLIRRIVLSRSYRMSGQISASAIRSDPKNSLWHHRPPRRLQGEAIRDSLLTIAGRLDNRLYGTPVPIHLTPFMDGRGRPATSGPLSGDGRRSIYVAVRRNFLSPMMLAFDTPTPFSTMGRRTSSNVPAQSLILMNDPFVIEQAKEFAQRIVASSPTTAARIDDMFYRCFGREPTMREIVLAKEFVAAEASRSNIQASEEVVWKHFAHALFNTKEFIFIP